VTIIANHGLLAFCDPHGIRPLVMGRQVTDTGVSYAFASETTCFDHLDFEVVRDLQPGEAGLHRPGPAGAQPHLPSPGTGVLRVRVHLLRPRDAVMNGRLVASERVRLGKRLGPRSAPPDCSRTSSSTCLPAPTSSPRPWPRSWASPTAGAWPRTATSGARSSPRPAAARGDGSQKLNPIRDIIRGRKVAVVDDSIVRGTTARLLVEMLRKAGAAEVYVVSAAPPIKHPCIYGIDMSARERSSPPQRDQGRRDLPGRRRRGLPTARGSAGPLPRPALLLRLLLRRVPDRRHRRDPGRDRSGEDLGAAVAAPAGAGQTGLAGDVTGG